MEDRPDSYAVTHQSQALSQGKTGSAVLYLQEGRHDLAGMMTSGIGNLIVANITEREVMMNIVVDGQGGDADFVQTRQRGENVDALVVEIGHG